MTAKQRRRAERRAAREQRLTPGLLRSWGMTRGRSMEDRHRSPLKVKGVRTRLRTLINKLTPKPERGPRPKYGVDFWRRGRHGLHLAIIVRQGAVAAPDTFEGYPVIVYASAR